MNHDQLVEFWDNVINQHPRITSAQINGNIVKTYHFKDDSCVVSITRPMSLDTKIRVVTKFGYVYTL